MQRVYLLLRNNRQTGPFNLEELVQQGLSFFDLIWIEGKSSAWSYPVEIEVLKPYLSDVIPKNEVPPASQQISHQTYMPSATAQAGVKKEEAGKKVFISLPNQFVNQPASEPVMATATEPERKPANFQSSTHSFKIAHGGKSDPAPEIKYNRTLHDVENEYTN